MDGQRHSSSRRRKSKRARTENKGNDKGKAREEPILIAARRPNAPAARPKRRFIAASAAPRKNDYVGGDTAEGEARNSATGGETGTNEDSNRPGLGKSSNGASRPTARNGATPDEPATRRSARIVQVQATGPDDREKQRLKLIDRLLRSEGRVAITRTAREIEAAGFDFPVAQEVQLQLLEHIDESFAHRAIANLAQLLVEEAPIKRPLFEQRLRRLEEFAEDADTRKAAAELRRAVRA